MEQSSSNELRALIARRQRQLLVHSFLYYICGESVIADNTYDAWYKELVALQARYTELAETTPYYRLTRNFDATGSAFFITQKDYPTPIISAAMHLLYNTRLARGGADAVPFEQFIARYGLALLTH